MGIRTGATAGGGKWESETGPTRKSATQAGTLAFHGDPNSRPSASEIKRQKSPEHISRTSPLRHIRKLKCKMHNRRTYCVTFSDTF